MAPEEREISQREVVVNVGVPSEALVNSLSRTRSDSRMPSAASTTGW